MGSWLQMLEISFFPIRVLNYDNTTFCRVYIMVGFPNWAWMQRRIPHSPHKCKNFPRYMQDMVIGSVRIMSSCFNLYSRYLKTDLIIPSLNIIVLPIDKKYYLKFLTWSLLSFVFRSTVFSNCCALRCWSSSGVAPSRKYLNLKNMHLVRL